MFFEGVATMTVLANKSHQASLIAKVVETPNRPLVEVLKMDSEQLQHPDVCRTLIRVLRINEAIACGGFAIASC